MESKHEEINKECFREDNLCELHSQIKNYHKQIFSNFNTQANEDWSKGNEKRLKKMQKIKKLIKVKHLNCDGDKCRHKLFLNVILNLVREAEQYKKTQTQKASIKKLVNKIVNGLKQDAYFPRFEEYFSVIKESSQKLDADHELKKCFKIFESTRKFVDECISRISYQKKQSNHEVIATRIERAEDLAYVCMRSDPHNEYELTKKLSSLEEVLDKHLLPLKETLLYDNLKAYLNEIIELYCNTINYLRKFQDFL